MAGGVGGGDGFVVFDPGLACGEVLWFDGPYAGAWFEPVGDAHAPGFAGEAGAEAVLDAAHSEEGGIDAEGLECLGDFLGARVEGLVHGEEAEAGGCLIDAEVPVGMGLDEAGDVFAEAGGGGGGL